MINCTKSREIFAHGFEIGRHKLSKLITEVEKNFFNIHKLVLKSVSRLKIADFSLYHMKTTHAEPGYWVRSVFLVTRHN